MWLIKLYVTYTVKVREIEENGRNFRHIELSNSVTSVEHISYVWITIYNELNDCNAKKYGLQATNSSFFLIKL